MRQTDLRGRELEDRLTALGLSPAFARTFGQRKDLSVAKMHELTTALSAVDAIKNYEGLTIFAAGSYARGEASEHSDVDLFFVATNGPDEPITHPNMRSIRIMAEVIDITERRLKLPSPSNDGEYLKILSLADNLTNLGSRHDDYQNHFTLRMLMLLESTPVFSQERYEYALHAFVEAYLRDYEDHAADFRPTFIVNDIIRFWKTLCLNYENKRNQPEDQRKIKQKIRNFKLAHSRLMTCFSTVALLASFKQIDKDALLAIFRLTPIERLLTLADKQPRIREDLRICLEQYHWFLDKTASPTADLEAYFSETNNRKEAFTHASKFGDAVYRIVNTAANDAGTIRYLVV